MTNPNAATPDSRHPCSLPSAALARWTPWFLLFVSLVAPSWAHGTTAIVTGANRVLVRRGPAKGFTPFASLSKGTKVEVREMHGEWARIVTPGGQVGYMKSTFLSVPSERPKAPAPTATPGVVLAPTASPTSAAASDALRSLSERKQSLEAEVRSLREELAGLRARTPAVAAATAGSVAAETEPLRAQVERLTTAVEGLQQRLDARPLSEAALPIASAPASGAPAVVSPIAILLGGVGLSIGWLLGSTYSRKQDRGRRPRIRF